MYFILVKFEQNRMVQATQNFGLFLQKIRFFETIFDKVYNPILEDVSVAETIV